jgi:hypothetical protein
MRTRILAAVASAFFAMPAVVQAQNSSFGGTWDGAPGEIAVFYNNRTGYFVVNGFQKSFSWYRAATSTGRPVAHLDIEGGQEVYWAELDTSTGNTLLLYADGHRDEHAFRRRRN